MDEQRFDVEVKSKNSPMHDTVIVDMVIPGRVTATNQPLRIQVHGSEEMTSDMHFGDKFEVILRRKAAQ